MAADDLDFGATIKGFTPGQKVFDRYTLTKILGRGGMGVVWLAQDAHLDREVALKFLPEVVANDAEGVADLKRETKRALNLTHPRIVRIYDFIEDALSPAISMEYVSGSSLSLRKLDQPDRCFAVEEIEKWAQQLCEALAYAHDEAKVVHRDLKPANLMLDENENLKVADFGISATLTDTTTRVSKAAGSSGSPPYMSPQQMLGKSPAATDDVYALGATLYELLTSKPPFYSGNVQLQAMQVVPSSIAERRIELNVRNTNIVPDAWEETIAACLAKEPGDRPQSAAEVWQRLSGNFDSHEEAQKGPKSEWPTVVSGVEVSEAEQADFNPKSAKETEPELTSSRIENPKSKMPAMMGLFALLAVLGTAGWWFGVEQPKREAAAAERVRIEEARIAAEELAAQAELARIEQEQAEADRLERERLAAEAAEAARLAAARGGVVVTTDPAGAEVMVGGFARERTPATLTDVKLGTYPVVVTLAGYEEQRLEVTVEENEFANLSVPLVRSTGGLSVASNPPGLEVAVSGDDYRPRTVQTPVKLDGLPTGEYTLTYRRADWPEQTHRVSVERNATASALAEFLGGGLEITTSPSGAEVWSAGKQLGTTPLNYADLKPGDFNLELRLKGYESAQRRGEVVSKETARVAVTLEEIRVPQSGSRYEIEDLGIELMPIAVGSFQMGSPSGERGRDSDETPHRVTISKPYWMGETEVTQGQWKALMGSTVRQQRDKSNPEWSMRGEGDRNPMYYVSWEEAMEYCRKLTSRERAAGRLPAGYGYTLPTEAQWEYACRAGTTGAYAGELDGMGWYDKTSGSTTHAVGEKRANAWGLYDMHGNVWEWCSDWYGDYPSGSVTDPAGASSGSFRVFRGGSWYGPAQDCRSAYRRGNSPGYRFDFLGFRVALTPSP